MYKIKQNQYFNVLMKKHIFIRDRNTNDNQIITLKVMLYICSILTEKGCNTTTLKISNRILKKDLKTTSLSLIEKSLEYISTIIYSYTVNKCNFKFRIIKSYEMNKGFIEIVFDEEFIELLNAKQYYEIPKEILKIDVRYFLTLFSLLTILLYIEELINLLINKMTKLEKRKEKNMNTISVEKLVAYCPTLLRYDELNEKHRQVHRAIIKPFENNLTYACNLLGLTWQYDRVLDEYDYADYIEFISRKIKFSMQE